MSRQRVMKVKRTIEIEIPGLGERIKAAREADRRSLSEICKIAGLSPVYWYDVESEKVRGSLQESTLRRIESALGVEFGVRFD